MNRLWIFAVMLVLCALPVMADAGTGDSIMVWGGFIACTVLFVVGENSSPIISFMSGILMAGVGFYTMSMLGDTNSQMIGTIIVGIGLFFLIRAAFKMNK